MPSNWNASISLDPPIINTAARTIGIPPNNNDLIVGPGFQSEKYIPIPELRIIAKKICGNAMTSFIQTEQ